MKFFFNKDIIKCLKPLVTKKQNYENIARLRDIHRDASRTKIQIIMLQNVTQTREYYFNTRLKNFNLG